jgi:hypothetical protein
MTCVEVLSAGKLPGSKLIFEEDWAVSCKVLHRGFESRLSRFYQAQS